MTEITPDLLRRARALREMEQRAGSENEMGMAAEALAKMLSKYNLSREELDKGHEAVAIVKNINGKYKETWRILCFASAAELYFCEHFFSSRARSKDVAVIHSIVGEPQNVEVAAEMAEYFEQTINRLANEACKANKSVTDRSHTDRHRFIRSFRIGAAQRLQARVESYVTKAKQGKLTDDSGQGMLPAVQSIYDVRDQLFKAFCELNGIKGFTTREGRDQMLSDLGTLLGQKAGNNISFTTQISPNSAQHALPSH